MILELALTHSLSIISPSCYVSLVSTNLAGRLPSLNLAIANFWAEMKAQGVEDQVTVIVGSEFGRTITPNANQGSDHAWAG